MEEFCNFFSVDLEFLSEAYLDQILLLEENSRSIFKVSGNESENKDA
jgi:hypothetical protein